MGLERCARQKSQPPGIVADIGPETRLGLHSFDFCRGRLETQNTLAPVFARLLVKSGSEGVSEVVYPPGGSVKRSLAMVLRPFEGAIAKAFGLDAATRQSTATRLPRLLNHLLRLRPQVCRRENWLCFASSARAGLTGPSLPCEGAASRHFDKRFCVSPKAAEAQSRASVPARRKKSCGDARPTSSRLPFVSSCLCVSRFWLRPDFGELSRAEAALRRRAPKVGVLPLPTRLTTLAIHFSIVTAR